MTQSIRIGAFRVAPFKRSGSLTGQWLIDAPATIVGKRTRRFFKNRKQAIEAAKKLDKAYRQGRIQRLDSESKPTGMTFAVVGNRWLEFQRLRVQTGKKRQSSLGTDLHRLKPILQFLADSLVEQVTEEKLMAYQAMRLSAGRKPATVNSEVVTVRKVLNWARRKKLLTTEVPTVENIPDHGGESIVPTPQEVVRIIEALPPSPAYLKPLVRLLAETGCRSGEAFNLTWDCVDEVNGFVQFRAKDGWTPKTHSSERKVAVGNGLLSNIRNLPKVGRYVFPGRSQGKPVTTIKKAFATAVRRAQIMRNGELVRVTPHSLRKCYATQAALYRGIPQAVLKDVLGHARGSKITDQYYVQVDDSSRRNATMELPL